MPDDRVQGAVSPLPPLREGGSAGIGEGGDDAEEAKHPAGRIPQGGSPYDETPPSSSRGGRGGAAARTAHSQKRPDAADVLRILADVPDPEIPAVSVVDLGIVRDLEWRGEKMVVTITPTYSACPATAVIGIEIANALRAQGFANVAIESRLAPPWTTDWISPEGRAKLKAFGIAPPSMACAGALNAPSQCPHCGSQRTERISQFGSTPCKAQYRCTDCLEPFDYFKRL